MRVIKSWSSQVEEVLFVSIQDRRQLDFILYHRQQERPRCQLRKK